MLKSRKPLSVCGIICILAASFFIQFYRLKIRESIAWVLTVWLAATLSAKAQRVETSDSLLLQRIYTYDKDLRPELQEKQMNVYSRYKIRTLKKNKLLMAIPTMHALSRGKNAEYAGETYSRITFNNVTDYELQYQVEIGTIPRYRRTLPTLNAFMTPDLYHVTLMNDHLLSPFHRRNAKCYRYGFRHTGTGTVELTFVPKLHNTQVVKGKAMVDEATGRIQNVYFEGEYDMISFRVFAEMGTSGFRSLIPMNCDISGVFHCAGNRIAADYHLQFDLTKTLADTIVGSHDQALMDSLRPVPLPDDIAEIYRKRSEEIGVISEGRAKNNKEKKKENVWKYVFWDVIGDNLVNRIKGNFGNNNQGSFRISPILNPLYLGYSGNRGLYYKFKVRFRYNFSEQQDLSAQFRGGYAFKQKQFYFRLPVTYTFSRQHDGHVMVEVGNGNRITNSSVKESIIDEQPQDSAKLEKMELDYFRDTYLKVRSNYDFNDYWGIGIGTTYHRRSAVDKSGFERNGRPSVYYSFAPMIKASLRPWGWKGPIFTINYEQGIKGLGNANMVYGRLETDVIWFRQFYRLRSLSMRWGGGVYTMKDKEAFFLDYENFREDNMPGGWNDDWTGDFQLLSRDTYNSSDYYLRANLTYESPLMLLSRAPFLGKYVEMERLYMSALIVDGIHPYTEMGYGFTNRLFSIGIFVATCNAKYDGIGFRFGLELFRDW